MYQFSQFIFLVLGIYDFYLKNFSWNVNKHIWSHKCEKCEHTVIKKASSAFLFCCNPFNSVLSNVAWCKRVTGHETEKYIISLYFWVQVKLQFSNWSEVRIYFGFTCYVAATLTAVELYIEITIQTSYVIQYTYAYIHTWYARHE